jgi:hypothetical protein
MSSLSGKNSNGRISGTRSSRVSSTLFYQLRNLDRKISLIDNQFLFFATIFNRKKVKILEKKREALDKKREKVRNKRKKYET